MECVNVNLFGKAFVLRFVGSETSKPVYSVNGVWIHLNASTFGTLTFIFDGVATTTPFSWEESK
jgi:hypothetical protein